MQARPRLFCTAALLACPGMAAEAGRACGAESPQGTLPVMDALRAGAKADRK